MRIVGRDDNDQVVFQTSLPHGQTPEVVVWDAGYVMVRALRAQRSSDGELDLEVAVRPVHDEAAPRRGTAGRDRDLIIADGERPEPRQRVAAYALVSSRRGLLATQYSDLTAVAGRWGMPGGGLDEGEEPVAGVLREVYEETAQVVTLEGLETVQTSHWIGRSPRGGLEDFHASGWCTGPAARSRPSRRCSTPAARPQPLAGSRPPSGSRVDWTPGWRAILGERYG